MNYKRVIYLVGSVLCAVGLLIALLATLSAAAAAPETPARGSTMDAPSAGDRWVILADLQTARGDAGAVAYGGKIHAVSGFFAYGFGYPSTQEIYDPQTNTWEYRWGPPVPRSDMVVANVGDKIYAIGGWIDPDSQGYNHMYDPVSSQWFTMTSMITPVSGAGGVVISDSIYVIGGFDSVTQSDTDHVQIYDTAVNSWTIGTPMTIGRSGLGAVLLNGEIYAIGGTYDANDVEIYDPATDQWRPGPALPDTRFSMAVVERSGNIYVIGGTNILGTGSYTDTTFIYDPGLGSWSSGPPMPTARSAVDAAVISNTIYVIGGVGEAGAGFANEAFGEFQFLPATTSILLDDPDPSQAFQPVVISYTVSSPNGAPTGWVTVTVDQSSLQCSSQLVGGAGSCGIAFDIPGTYTLTASYSGDTDFSTSSDSESHTVIKAATTTTLTRHTPDPSLQGQVISVTFGVSSTYGFPAGSVSVTASGSTQSCTGGLSGGEGGCTIALDGQGLYTLTASYAGDISFAPSSDQTSHLVIDLLRLFLPLISQE